MSTQDITKKLAELSSIKATLDDHHKTGRFVWGRYYWQVVDDIEALTRLFPQAK